MTSTEPTLNLTYDELLEQTQIMLHTISENISDPPDAFYRGLCTGVISLWYKLALEMNAPGLRCNEDYDQLLLLAGLTSDGQKLPAVGATT